MPILFAGVIAAVFFPMHVFAASACAAPLTYSIGSLDARFGLTKPQLVDYLTQAEAVWEVPKGRDLFQYRATGGAVTVNLFYDSRQASTDSQKSQLAKLAAVKSAFDLISNQLQGIASSTTAAQAVLKGQYETYAADEAQFNTDVASSNARGGASPEEFSAFKVREQALAARFADLKTQQTTLNDKATRINTLGDVLDSTARAVNAYIAQYNASLAKAGEYEEGYYRVDNGVRSIGLYQFTDTTALVRALAHEFGHALGMDHVINPTAIMYAKNQATSTAATAADIAELDTACGF